MSDQAPARATWPRQLRLPGQAAALEGPVDLRMMYVMHHAFRRDRRRRRVWSTGSARGRGSAPMLHVVWLLTRRGFDRRQARTFRYG